jgi:30S ribosomal protein S31
MGKGDKKTPKGKRSAGSYGNARPQGTNKTAPKAAAKAAGKTTVAKPAAKPVAKAPAKTVVKKVAPPPAKKA